MANRRSRTTTRRSVRRGGRRKTSRVWTRGECAFMRKYYRNHETKWVARQLGRSVYAIRYKAVDLSLKKASPSVWKGNKGPKTAFRRFGGSTTPVGRRSPSRRRKTSKRRATSKRRTTRGRSWRAASRRRTTTRKRSTRRTR